jgi:GDSL-like lipase/acylhydrolase family protein
LRFRSIILFLAIVAIAGWSFFYAYRIGPFRPELSRERYFAIRAAIGKAHSPVIVFGDSIVLTAPLPVTVCGWPLVNAGVGGAGIQYFERYSIELLGSSTPKLIVLAVGINNAHAGAALSFRSRYQKTVERLKARAPVLLATITPARPGPLAEFADPEAVPLLNGVIKEMAGAEATIDLYEPMTDANFTTDGIHLNAQGYVLWTKVMMQGLEKALGCNA